MPRATVAEATLSVIPEIFLVKKLLSSESDRASVFTARSLALTLSKATSWAFALVSLVCRAVTAASSTWRNLSRVPCRSSFEPTPNPLIVPNDDMVLSPRPQRVPTHGSYLPLLLRPEQQNLSPRTPKPRAEQGLM